MLKLLAVLAVVFSVTQAFLPIAGQASNSSARTGSNLRQGGTNDHKETASSLASKEEYPSPSSDGNRTKKTDQNTGDTMIVSECTPVPKRDWTDWVIWIGQITLVIFGGIGIGLALFTAKAALLNAKAVINAERAWITVTPHVGSPNFYPMREKSAPIPDDLVEILPIAHLFAGKLVNVGKTPAKIEAVAIRYVRSPTHPSHWNVIPDYGEISEREFFVFPDEVNTISANLSPVATMTQSQIDAVLNEEEFLYAFGIVKYRDVYEQPHETRFGYMYKVQDRHLIMKDGIIETIRTGEARFRRDGPAKYNAHT
jgi:hypothetical protein